MTYKKNIFHLFLLVTILASTLAFGTKSSSAETIAYIKEARELIVCASPRAEPLSDVINIIETPKYPGIHIDFANSLAKKINVSIKFKWIDFFFRPEQVKCDVFMGIPSITKNDPPHPFLKKSISYVRVKKFFVSLKDYNLKSIKSFKGLRVAAHTGSAVQDILRNKNSGAKLLVSYLEDNKKLDALIKGDVDVALVTSINLGWYKKNHPSFKPITISTKIVAQISEYSYTLGLHKADQSTVQIFNNHITEMINDGSLKKIFEHYGVKYEIKQH